MCVAALAAVICVRAVHAQNSPSVGGYRLGQTWARASGRTMPCNRNAGVGSDIPNAKFCKALNGLHLRFQSDTLVQIFMDSSGPNPALARVNDLWRTRWSAKTIALLGQPDSVTLRTEPSSSTVLVAWWDHQSHGWCAAFEMRGNYEVVFPRLWVYTPQLDATKRPFCIRFSFTPLSSR